MNQTQALTLMPIGGKPSAVAAQSPSMQAIMARNPDLIPAPAPIPIDAIAQTPAAAAAIASRQQAINESLAGKTDKATGRPRKF